MLMAESAIMPVMPLTADSGRWHGYYWRLVLTRTFAGSQSNPGCVMLRSADSSHIYAICAIYKGRAGKGREKIDKFAPLSKINPPYLPLFFYNIVVECFLAVCNVSFLFVACK